MDYELVSTELIRSLRGKRSQASLSRLLGYKSNIVNRWESRRAFPTAARFMLMVEQLQRGRPPIVRRFFARMPASFASPGQTSRATAAALLRELRGRTPISSIASDTGFNRYSVSRWLNATAEPRLPEFLHLIEAMSRRALDFIACCTDPATMSSVAGDWNRLQLSREAAYDMPWSHAVLRALELDCSTTRHRKAWLAERLGAAIEAVSEALDLLERTGQVKNVRGKWQLKRAVSVNTAQDQERAHALKVFWTEVGLERMRASAPGNYGYSLFAISKEDLRLLRELHLEYVRAMQNVIAASKPGECVGLYCAQLLDLAASHNALEP